MRAVIRVSVLALLAAATGCSGGRPIEVWKASVETYIEEEANNDPGALRAVGDRPSQREFGVIGAAKSGMTILSSTRTDVTGVLVGHRNIEARWWFVFLVGSVTYHGKGVVFPIDDPTVDFIRLAAMSADDGGSTWVLGEADPGALALYRAAQLEQWRRSHPSRADAVEGPTVYPSEGDDLQLTIEGGVIRVTEQRTGASWTVTIPAAVASDRSATPST